MEGTPLARRLADLGHDLPASLGNQMAPIRADHHPCPLPHGSQVCTAFFSMGFQTQLLQNCLNFKIQLKIQ